MSVNFKKRGTKKKILLSIAAAMALALAIGSFAMGEGQTPATPQANGDTGAFTVTGGTAGTDYDFTGTTEQGGVLTVHPQDPTTEITIGNSDIGTKTTDRIEVTSAATIVLKSVNIWTPYGPSLKIQDNATFDVTVILADNKNNYFYTQAFDDVTPPSSAALQKNDDGTVTPGTLTIKGEAAGNGLLDLQGWDGAGIGGANDCATSNITIQGGKIVASAGSYAAGIGSGRNKDATNIKIEGGDITAAGLVSAGIGGGYRGSGSNITISGGKVLATHNDLAGQGGAGIGGGNGGGNGSNITINGGTVMALGSENSAGIGGGSGGNGTDIQIIGSASVTVISGDGGAGIGGGADGTGSNNLLNGDVEVIVAGNKVATEGFTWPKGLIFESTDNINFSGHLYGDVNPNFNWTVPGDLTIPQGQTLTVAENTTATIDGEATITNEGTLQIDGTLLNEKGNGVEHPEMVSYGQNGKITVKITWSAGEGADDSDTYPTYWDISGQQNYPALSAPTKEDYSFAGWYTQPEGAGEQIQQGDLVQPSLHTIYAKWNQTVADQFDVEGEGVVKGTDYRYNGDYALEILSNKKMTIKNANSNGATHWRIEVKNEANLVLDGVNIEAKYNSALKIQDNATFDVNIEIADGSENVLKSTNESSAALQKNDDGTGTPGTLTITSPEGSEGTGKLEVDGGGERGAGIGSKGKIIDIDGNIWLFNTSNIIIKNCTIIAKGGYYGAGIGGGLGGSGSNIQIYNCKITAIGGDGIESGGAAGIGGGSGQDGNDIIIKNCEEVTVTGGVGGGAAIGGGCGGNGNNIQIVNNNKVIADGGSLLRNVILALGGAGIGGGCDGNATNIQIVNNNSVIATGKDGGAGIGGGYGEFGGDGVSITIEDSHVEAKAISTNPNPDAGYGGAGIGGGIAGKGQYITIRNSDVQASGGIFAAGIGNGAAQNYAVAPYPDGTDITIENSRVTATGYLGGAGIGGGVGASGKRISIHNSVVNATGGYLIYKGIEYSGAGIGGGGYYQNRGGDSSDNTIDENSVVIATSGHAERAALEGFDDSTGGNITQAITFTRQGQESNGEWSSNIYGNVTLSQDATFPANLTIKAGEELAVGDGATLTIPAGVTLQNEGTLTENGSIDCSEGGAVTTLINYDAQGGSASLGSEYKTYRDISGIKSYENLPSATRDGFTLGGWYTDVAGAGTLAAADTLVDVNQHNLYANWTNNPEPTPDPSVDPDGGDGSGASSKTSDPFMGGIALALLGVATTGAILTRKLR